MHWLERKQRGNIPGRCGSGRGRVSHVGQRNSLRTNRIASPALLLRAVTHKPAPLPADVPGCGVVGRDPAFPALTEPVLSRFRRPRLLLVPGVSARKFLPVQVVIYPPADSWQPEENALATLDPGHTPSQLRLRFEISGTILL